jgi:hypothetical protein
MARFKLGGGSKLLLMVVGTLVVVITLMMTFIATPPEKSGAMLGALVVKDSRRMAATQKTSNYQSIKDQQKKEAKSTLRYKERKSEENPFFSLYRAQKAQPKPQKKKMAPIKVVKETKKEEGFFNAFNSDLKSEKCFFEAVFREPQQVQDGKALRIFLKEAIPALQLEAGTILKGVPYLEGGSRLQIRITAAIIEDKVKKIELRCFDKEDCMEGLYHDELAAQLEEETKTGLLDEVFDVDLSEGAMARRGGRIVRKFSDLTRRNKKIIIERGKALFLAVPEQPEA